MKNISVIRRLIKSVILMQLLVGCSDLAKKPTTADPIFPVEAEKPVDKKNIQPMNNELLYVLLSAEIAGQRGQFDIAMDRYLKATEWSKNPQVAERATQIALYVKDYTKAQRAASIWVEGDPDNAAANSALALVYLINDDQENATKAIDRWLALSDDQFGRSMIELVKMLEKHSSDPLALMGQLEGRYGDKPEFLLGYALLALSRNQSSLALEYVDSALSIKPEWENAQVLKARIVAKQDDETAARATLEAMVAGNPNNAELRFIVSQFFIKVGDYQAARSELEQVVRLDGDKYDAQFSLAGVNLKLKDEAAAKALFLELTDVPEWQDQAHLFLGRLDADAGRSEAAVGWFDRVSNGALKVDAELSAVIELAKLNRTAEANNRLSDLRKRYPDEAVRFYLIEAEILTNKKDYSGAFELLNTALTRHPDRSELLYSRALVAERIDRLDILERDLKTILANDPDDVNALNALGYTLVDRTSRLEEAQGFLQRAINLKPDDPVIIDSFGWLQFKLGNYDLALEYLRRAFEGDPDPEIAAHLGEVLWVSGREAQAKSVWKKANQDDPGNEYIEVIKNRFPQAFEE